MFTLCPVASIHPPTDLLHPPLPTPPHSPHPTLAQSAGDQLLRTDMSDAQREQLQALLDDIYSTWVKGGWMCGGIGADE